MTKVQISVNIDNLQKIYRTYLMEHRNRRKTEEKKGTCSLSNKSSTLIFVHFNSFLMKNNQTGFKISY